GRAAAGDRRAPRRPPRHKNGLAPPRPPAPPPSLLLPGEAMSAPTPTETAAAVTLVRRIHEDMAVTICVVEHVMEVVMPLSHRVVVLDYGVKIADGAPHVVVRDEQVIRAFLGARRARRQFSPSPPPP